MADIYVDLRERRLVDLEPVKAGLEQLSDESDSLVVITSRLDSDYATQITDMMREAGLEIQKKGGQGEEFLVHGYFKKRR